MSRIRPGTCAEPGPYDQHCTEDRWHDYSHYDAGEDSSWNDRSPEGWQGETPHACDEATCRGNRSEVVAHRGDSLWM